MLSRNMDVLTEALKYCASNEGSNGGIDDCPVLYKSAINNYKWQCPERDPQIGEQVFGILDKLPGCNKVTTGPERATSADMSCPADAPKPSVTLTVDSAPIATIYPTVGDMNVGNQGWQYLGCTEDNPINRTLSATIGGNATTMTVESCQNFCVWKGYSLGKHALVSELHNQFADLKTAGAQFGSECYCGNYFRDNITPTFNATGCTYRCAGDFTRNVSPPFLHLFCVF